MKAVREALLTNRQGDHRLLWVGLDVHVLHDAPDVVVRVLGYDGSGDVPVLGAGAKAGALGGWLRGRPFWAALWGPRGLAVRGPRRASAAR